MKQSFQEHAENIQNHRKNEHLSKQYSENNEDNWTDKVYSKIIEAGESISLSMKAFNFNEFSDHAETAADIIRVLGGVSSVFHLDMLVLRATHYVLEADRGRRRFPEILLKISEKAGPIINSSNTVKSDEKFLAVNLSNLMQQTMIILVKIEHFLMESSSYQIIHTSLIRDVEKCLAKLEVQTAGVVPSENILKIVNYNKDIKPAFDNIPRKNQYFVGREKELRKMKEILLKYGSLAITQFEGVGKTQLCLEFI